jgi:hypothetical protein
VNGWLVVAWSVWMIGWFDGCLLVGGIDKKNICGLLFKVIDRLLNDFGLVVFLVVLIGRLNEKPWMIGWFFDRLIE